MHAASGISWDSLEAMGVPPHNASDLLLAVRGLWGKEFNLDAFLQLLVDQVARRLDADRGTLYLLDAPRGELFSRAAHLPEISEIRLKLGQGVAGQVALEGVPVRVPDPKNAPHFFAEIDRMTGYQTHSLLAVPLRGAQQEVFGVLQVLNRRGGAGFDDEDTGRLVEAADGVSRALQATSLYPELRRARLQPRAPVSYFFNNIVGESAPMRALYRTLQKAAASDATVLLRGESGTGKELFARALHVNSARRDAPFVKVDCAALPATLIENELFGHEKGAFTGADSRGPGKFEAAQGGTVFLDELGELPLPVQGKLLRVLQDREFERVGGTQPVPVDLRVVAATHRDLAQMVSEGRFREDLYYRIKVVELVLPPLRERGPEDIERLAHHFVAAAAARHGIDRAPTLTPAALERLRAHAWPGNVRELQNCLESAVVLSEGSLDAVDLPLATRRPVSAPVEEGQLTLAEMERHHIERVMAACGQNQTAAARVLGIGRNTLARKLKEMS
jgi:Nif-specific regulatory protein